MEMKNFEGVKGKMFLMPCAKDVCQECAVKHEEFQPHKQDSLYYQYKFYGEHGRFPTWEDAMEHCSEEIKTTVIAVLEEHKINWKQV